MRKNIGSIVWPAEPAVAIRFYLRFLLKVIEVQHLKFPDLLSDPIPLVTKFLEGKISTVELNREANTWWGFLDAGESLRNFENREALFARLAICLLCIKEQDALELGDHLSWFIEVLGFLGVDTGEVIAMMEVYFEFEKTGSGG